MKQATFAGKFYPAAESTLKKAVEECFTGERGPGSLPLNGGEEKISALILPHGDLPLSGPCAAWGYHALSGSKKPDFFIILGASHHGGSGTTTTTMETPFGMVRTEQHFLRGLVEKGSISLNPDAFVQEYSIETQLPFLQFLYGDSLKIAPILVDADLDLKQLALDIKETLVELGKTAVIIVSSNFTRHGPEYKQVRFSENPPEQIAAFDKQHFDLIETQNPQSFREFVDKELSNVCGALAITLLLHLLKPCEMQLEQYYTSKVITGDKKNSVSYAAITFREK